jgi:hypothetical protein
MTPGLKPPVHVSEPSLQLFHPQIVRNQSRELPPNVDRFLSGKKGCKRFVYRLNYLLLNFAYTSAHTIVYLQSTGRAESHFLDLIRFILRLENIASPGASW